MTALAAALYSCGLRADGSAVCWGSGAEEPQQAPDARYTSISAGYYHACGVLTDGSAVCWEAHNSEVTTFHPGPFTSVSAGLDSTWVTSRKLVSQCTILINC